MSVNPHFFSNFWLVVGILLYGSALLMAVRAAQWWRLSKADDLNVLLYAILGVFFIWSMNADFPASQSLAGLSLHLLGATLLTMMFGWAFAILSMSMVLLAFTLMTTSITAENLMTLPWNALATCVLPVFVSYFLFRLVDRYLPNHFFIYIFICAFFGAALAMGSAVLATTSLHALSGAFSLDRLSYNYLPYGLILMLPEAFITGMLMSVFVAYRPEWVSTFDDNRYLRNH
jgi:uncharacterized membrane protein